MTNTSKQLYVSALGEVDHEGFSFSSRMGKDINRLRETFEAAKAPLSEHDLQFVKKVWEAQERFADGRFNVRGIWPHLVLDTELIYPVSEYTTAKIAYTAKDLKMEVEPMDSPTDGTQHVCLSRKFNMADMLLGDMADQHAFIRTHTQKLWDLYGMHVS